MFQISTFSKIYKYDPPDLTDQNHQKILKNGRYFLLAEMIPIHKLTGILALIPFPIQ